MHVTRVYFLGCPCCGRWRSCAAAALATHRSAARTRGRRGGFRAVWPFYYREARTSQSMAATATMDLPQRQIFALGAVTVAVAAGCLCCQANNATAADNATAKPTRRSLQRSAKEQQWKADQRALRGRLRLTDCAAVTRLVARLRAGDGVGDGERNFAWLKICP